MYKLTFRSWILFSFLISSLVCSTFSYAGEGDFGYRVFEIQKKYAIKGSRLAQYKLGTFYEFGISVKPNPQEAIIWYKKSASKKNKPAKNRLRYLDIKLNGYKKSKHDTWVVKIRDEANSGNVHSIIILGQLNHYGLGMKKNLKVALDLLRLASSRGYAEIDFEIDEILKQTGKREVVHSQPVVIEVIKPAEKTKPAVVSKPAPPAKPQVRANSAPPPEPVVNKTLEQKPVVKKESEEEKELIRRKRYVEAMRKQYEEQLLLQQQQDWSEGEE